MAEPEGEYVQVGDVQEWRWHPGHEPKVTVPEGEFDPRSAPNPDDVGKPEPEPEPAPRSRRAAKRAKAK